MPNYAQNWFIHTPIEQGEVLYIMAHCSALRHWDAPLNSLQKTLWGRWAEALTIDLDRGVTENGLNYYLNTL